MTNNLNKYQKLIDNFRGKVSKKNFETLFTLKFASIPKKERFLLKMELKRLDGACTRLIDLRGLVDGECRVFEHDGRTHFLDSTAIKVYKENFALYGGYTLGVYEAVSNTENNFRVIYQKEKTSLNVVKDVQAKAENAVDKKQYPAKSYKFGDYHNRIEERMNFSMALFIKCGDKEIECKSSDLSVNGCKYRVPSTEKFQIGQVISIRFVGLAQEFEFGSESSFDYEIKNIQLINNIQLIGVKRCTYTGHVKDGFKAFLKGFIQGNKRRYKINLDNTLTALHARKFEQYVLPKSNELPVFIAQEKSNLLPKYALTCLNNHNIFEYWQDEKRNSTLHFLITEERLQRLKKLFVLGESLLVYSFTVKSNGKCFFYSADDYQLKEDAEFMAEFLGFAANTSDFAISTLTLSDFNKEKANSFYTLSDSLTKKNQYLNLPVSDENLKKLDELSYLVIVNNITNDNSINTYKKLPFSDINTVKLKAYGHKRMVQPLLVEEVAINYKNHRQETRFTFKTPVDVMSVDDSWAAESINFSTLGLKLEFAESVTLNRNDIVYLSFPKLQKITSLFDLKSLPYSIVRINTKKTIVHLKVHVDKHNHIGKSFFKALIEKNKDKLTSDEYDAIFQNLVKPLRNIYSYSSNIPNLIIQTSGSRYKIEALTYGQEYGRLMPLMRQLSNKVGMYNLSPILSNLNITNTLTVNLKQMNACDVSPITDILYVAINHGAEFEQQVITKHLSELETLNHQNMFIKNALKNGEFLCLQLKLSRTNAPDMEYLNPELSYISTYAMHRGKQIEQDIWSVSGVLQVIDITNEAMLKLKLETEHVK